MVCNVPKVFVCHSREGGNLLYSLVDSRLRGNDNMVPCDFKGLFWYHQIMAELKLDSPIQYLKGVGPKMAEKLKRLEIETPADLLYHIPRAYIDYSHPVPIKSTRIGDLAVIRGKISAFNIKRTARKWMSIVEFLVSDDSGSIKIIYFNQPYLKDTFKEGDELYFYSKISYDFSGSIKSLNSPDFSREPRIVPIYPETKNITSKYLNKLMVNSLSSPEGRSPSGGLIDKTDEYLPVEIKQESKVIDIDQAIKYLHQPRTMAETDLGKRRLAFDELYLTALQTQIYRQKHQEQKAVAIQIEDDELRIFVADLPFILTDSQRKACWQIILDLKGRENQSTINHQRSTISPMNRLLNGDVGSGKTVVAAMAAFAVIKSGRRVIVMAPTEVLAFQHYTTFQEILGKYGISIGLVTGSRRELSNNVIPAKAGIQELEKSGSQVKPGMTNKNGNKTAIQQYSNEQISKADLLVGTHALLEDAVDHDNVALVVVDEQHRFGVEQRAKIQKMTMSRNVIPVKTGIQESLKTTGSRVKPGMMREGQEVHAHFLSMTATPIPRTLQLTLYGDLDVSIIDEMPKGRKQIETKVYGDREREAAYKLIRKEIKAGRQAFVICSLIEEQITQDQKSKIKNQNIGSSLFEIDRKTVVAEQKRLQEEVFPELRIGLMHGKLKPKDKEAVMKEFTSHKLDILVSTSVVEVGVDVSNASVMIIEDADRFGLAQLHQFRGRVGRAEHQSHCLLMAQALKPDSIKRLKAMEEFNSGFKLAEIDLGLRGPGVIYGKEQSGFGDLRLDWVSDIFLLEEAREAAKKTIQLYPDLSVLPLLESKLSEKFSQAHLE